MKPKRITHVQRVQSACRVQSVRAWTIVLLTEYTVLYCSRTRQSCPWSTLRYYLTMLLESEHNLLIVLILNLALNLS